MQKLDRVREENATMFEADLTKSSETLEAMHHVSIRWDIRILSAKVIQK